MNWSDQYIGLKYSKYDCAQFVKLALKKTFGFNFKIPQFENKSLRNRSNIIKKEATKAHEIKTPFEGCLILMECSGGLNHIGLYTKINNIHHCVHSLITARGVVLHSFKKLDLLGMKKRKFYEWPK